MTSRSWLAAVSGALLLLMHGPLVVALQGQTAGDAEETAVEIGTKRSKDAEPAAKAPGSVMAWAAFSFATALGVVLGFLLGSRPSRHLRSINDQLAALQPETLGNRIKAPGRDPEIAELVRQINALLSRVGRSYDELSEFSARVAHELRTPLTLLRMRVEESAADLPPDFSEELQEEIRRLSRLVDRSLATARAQGGRLPVKIATVDLSGLLEELREDYETLAKTKDVPLGWEVPAGVPVSADRDLLRQILHNLLDNALRHGSGRTDVLVARRDKGDLVGIEIRNESCHRKKNTDGTGIGLRLVKALVGSMPGMEFSAARQESHYTAMLVCPAHAAAQGVSPVFGGVVGKFAWIGVRGRGTFQNSVALAKFADDAIKSEHKSLVIDWSECTNADSTFLGAVAAVAMRLRRAGGDLFFEGADEQMVSLLADYGLGSIAAPVGAPLSVPPASAFRELSLEATFETKRRMVIESHEALAMLTPENAERFRESLDFLKHRIPKD